MASSLKLLVGGASAIGASALTSYLLMSDSTVSMIRIAIVYAEISFNFCENAATQRQRTNLLETLYTYHGKNISLRICSSCIFPCYDLILCSLLVYFFVRKSNRLIDLWNFPLETSTCRGIIYVKNAFEQKCDANEVLDPFLYRSKSFLVISLFCFL